MLNAAPLGVATGLPTSWCTGAIGFLHLRGTALVLDQVNSDVDRVKPCRQEAGDDQNPQRHLHDPR